MSEYPGNQPGQGDSLYRNYTARQAGYGAVPPAGEAPYAPPQDPFGTQGQPLWGQPSFDAQEQPQFSGPQPLYAQQGWGQPPQPPAMPPKQRMALWQIIVILIALAALIVYLFATFSPDAAMYATIETGTLGAHYTGSALIVRNEVPFDAEGVTSIQYVAEEGKTVTRNTTICNVFSSGYSTREMTALQEYRDEIRDYQKTLLRSETTYDAKMARVESDVLTRSREVREIIAGTKGNLPNQEKLLQASIDARQQYLKQKYSSDQRLSRLYDDELAQMQRIDSWTKQYIASKDTIVSFYSDGYEYGLTTSNYAEFNPAQVRRMINGEKPEKTTVQKGKTTIYRTVTDGSWVVLMLVDDTSWNPVEGQTYQLQLERFENTVVEARVESFTRSGGELLVRLTVQGSVYPVLYMRTCYVELGDYVTTMKVPARAIYRQDEMDGVVIVDGSNQSFIPVTIVKRDGDYVYITAVTQGLLYDGQTVRLF